MMRVVATAVAGALVLGVPSASPARSGCPNRGLRTMLAEAGQGLNGRLIALHERYITRGGGAPRRRSVDRRPLRRRPAWRMADALRGRPPCPKPGVRISDVRVEGRTAHVGLRLSTRTIVVR